MPSDDLTLAVVHAVVGFQCTDALALAQAIHDAVAWIAQALCFHGPRVHNAARELVARHKLARVCMVGWTEGRRQSQEVSVYDMHACLSKGKCPPHPSNPHP